jgi:hypothetical protein
VHLVVALLVDKQQHLLVELLALVVTVFQVVVGVLPAELALLHKQVAMVEMV